MAMLVGGASAAVRDTINLNEGWQFHLGELSGIEAVKNATQSEGVSAVIFKSPCISIASKLGYKFSGAKKVENTKCLACKKCINELGCPALVLSEETNSKGKNFAAIDSSLCTGCGLCTTICPVNAIE